MLIANFSERLREALIARHMTQAELIRQTGIAKSNISQYLSGRCVPKREYVLDIAAALDINFMWLLGHDTSMEPPSKQTVNTEQVINTMRHFYGELSARVIINYLKLNEYGQLKVSEFINQLLEKDKYRSEI